MYQGNICGHFYVTKGNRDNREWNWVDFGQNLIWWPLGGLVSPASQLGLHGRRCVPACHAIFHSQCARIPNKQCFWPWLLGRAPCHLGEPGSPWEKQDGSDMLCNCMLSRHPFFGLHYFFDEWFRIEDFFKKGRRQSFLVFFHFFIRGLELKI